jgi:hypothetical protein
MAAATVARHPGNDEASPQYLAGQLRERIVSVFNDYFARNVRCRVETGKRVPPFLHNLLFPGLFQALLQNATFPRISTLRAFGTVVGVKKTGTCDVAEAGQFRALDEKERDRGRR